MRYFKIIANDRFVGVVNSNDFRKYNQRNNFLGLANETNGEYIDYNSDLYRDTWMKVPVSDTIEFIRAAVQEIDEELYNKLHIIINEPVVEYPVMLDQDEPEEELEVEDPLDTITVEYAREVKIKEMSHICNKLIEEGIDVAGLHYSMTTQDQLNLLNAQMLLLSGATSVPYHADNEPYRDYTETEMIKIIETANEHKNNILQHFNELKQYILSLDNLDDVIAVQWN